MADRYAPELYALHGAEWACSEDRDACDPVRNPSFHEAQLASIEPYVVRGSSGSGLTSGLVGRSGLPSDASLRDAIDALAVAVVARCAEAAESIRGGHDPDERALISREAAAQQVGYYAASAIGEDIARLRPAIERGATTLDRGRLASALRHVTRPLLFAGDRGYEKWLGETADEIAAQYERGEKP